MLQCQGAGDGGACWQGCGCQCRVHAAPCKDAAQRPESARPARAPSAPCCECLMLLMFNAASLTGSAGAVALLDRALLPLTRAVRPCELNMVARIV